MRGRRPVGSAQAGGRGAGEAESPAGTPPQGQAGSCRSEGSAGSPAGSQGHPVPPALPSSRTGNASATAARVLRVLTAAARPGLYLSVQCNGRA